MKYVSPPNGESARASPVPAHSIIEEDWGILTFCFDASNVT